MTVGSKILHVTIGVVVGFLASACAPYQSLKGYDERPMTASMVPLGAVDEAPAQPVVEEDDSAGALLERGFLFFHQNQPDEAASAFRGAIATGNLNDAGRALAYWHIAESRRRLHDEDRAAEALASFAVVAQDVMDIRDQRRFAVDQDGDFVKNFRLVSRLAEARGYVNAIWARRAEDFGRSLDDPILAETDEEASYFLQFVAPCTGSLDSRIDREALAVDGEPLDHIRVERVTVFCESEQSIDQFFIVVPAKSDAE